MPGLLVAVQGTPNQTRPDHSRQPAAGSRQPVVWTHSTIDHGPLAEANPPIDASPLGELIVNTRLSILEADDKAAIARLGELHRVLVNPLVEVGFEIADYDTLYIVPHSILHGVPFAALRTPDGRFLAEHVATVIVPSASVWEVLRQREAKPPASFLGFANPILDDDYLPLPETEAELETVTTYLTDLDVRVHTGSDASEAVLRQDVHGRGIVHFATHGEFPEADVMNMHRILLSAAGDQDGHVNAEALRGMDLSAAQLVVLSICDGGVYRFGPGDEPYGLLSARPASPSPRRSPWSGGARSRGTGPLRRSSPRRVARTQPESPAAPRSRAAIAAAAAPSAPPRRRPASPPRAHPGPRPGAADRRRPRGRASAATAR